MYTQNLLTITCIFCVIVPTQDIVLRQSHSELPPGFAETEKYGQRSDEYQTYLVERGYNPSEVSRQFERAKALPRETLPASKPKDKKIIFPLVVDYNPHLPNISKILKSYSHLI